MKKKSIIVAIVGVVLVKVLLYTEEKIRDSCSNVKCPWPRCNSYSRAHLLHIGPGCISSPVFTTNMSEPSQW